jgi:hypothetical protein
MICAAVCSKGKVLCTDLYDKFVLEENTLQEAERREADYCETTYILAW